MVHGGNNKGYQQYQEKGQPTDYSTKHTTRSSHPHHISLNITSYATQVNRQHVNIVIDTVEQLHQDDHHTLQHHKFTV